MKGTMKFNFIFLFVCFAACKSDPVPVPEPESDPIVNCGDFEEQSCYDNYYISNTWGSGTIEIVPEGPDGSNCLLLVNPHTYNEINPQSIWATTIVDPLKAGEAYKVSFDVKMKGYPDFVPNPSFALMIYSNDDWYGEYYEWSAGGIYYESDWKECSFFIFPESDIPASLDILGKYDSVWVDNLTIVQQ